MQKYLANQLYNVSLLIETTNSAHLTFDYTESFKLSLGYQTLGKHLYSQSLGTRGMDLTLFLDIPNDLRGGMWAKVTVLVFRRVKHN
jgi:hypothetical protein